MSKKFVHYLVPLFLVGYFIIAFTPVFITHTGEIFPFFSFKLYSKVPSDFVKYDLMYNKGEADEFYLIHENGNLNRLERKNFNYRLNLIGDQFEDSVNVFTVNYADLLEKGKSVYLVKISGNYIGSVRDGVYEVDLIKRLK